MSGVSVIAVLVVLCGPPGSARLEAELRGYTYVDSRMKSGHRLTAYAAPGDGILPGLAFVYETGAAQECIIMERQE